RSQVLQSVAVQAREIEEPAQIHDRLRIGDCALQFACRPLAAGKPSPDVLEKRAHLAGDDVSIADVERPRVVEGKMAAQKRAIQDEHAFDASRLEAWLGGEETSERVPAPL